MNIQKSLSSIFLAIALLVSFAPTAQAQPPIPDDPQGGEFFCLSLGCVKYGMFLPVIIKN